MYIYKEYDEYFVSAYYTYDCEGNKEYCTEEGRPLDDYEEEQLIEEVNNISASVGTGFIPPAFPFDEDDIPF